MARISRKNNDCPNVAATLSIKRLGGRWKILILRLLLDKPSRYSELKREIEGITDKMLTQQLREMEEDGILLKHVIVVEPPMTVQYELTELGYKARDVVDALTRWGRAIQTQK